MDLDTAPRQHNIHEIVTDGLRSIRTGIPTSFPDLDTLTGGLQRGNLTVIAGRPSHGSSMLALTLARAAVAAQRETYYAALEAPAHAIAQRFASAESQVAMHWITAGVCGPAEEIRLNQTRERIQAHALPLILDDQFRTLADVEEILDAYDDDGPELLIVDGADLLDVEEILPHDRARAHERAAEIARVLKTWAVDRQMHVIATTHLTLRPRDAHRDCPALIDFGWRQAYAHTADLVILVDRPDVDLRNSPRLGEVDLILAKHRNGPTAVLTGAFQGHFGRIVPMVEPEPTAADEMKEPQKREVDGA